MRRGAGLGRAMGERRITAGLDDPRKENVLDSDQRQRERRITAGLDDPRRENVMDERIERENLRARLASFTGKKVLIIGARMNFGGVVSGVGSSPSGDLYLVLTEALYMGEFNRQGPVPQYCMSMPGEQVVPWSAIDNLGPWPWE